MNESVGGVGGTGNTNPIDEKVGRVGPDEAIDTRVTTLEDLKRYLYAIGKGELYEYFVQTQGLMMVTATQKSMRGISKAMKELKKAGNE